MVCFQERWREWVGQSRVNNGAGAAQVANATEKAQTQCAARFPFALWCMLLHPNGAGIIEWVSPTHFRLNREPHHPKRTAFLLSFFSSGLLASFLRQLSYWGFSSSDDAQTYSNPHFVQLQPEALAGMQRLKRQQDPFESWRERGEDWTDPAVMLVVERQLAAGWLQ